MLVIWTYLNKLYFSWTKCRINERLLTFVLCTILSLVFDSNIWLTSTDIQDIWSMETLSLDPPTPASFYKHYNSSSHSHQSVHHSFTWPLPAKLNFNNEHKNYNFKKWNYPYNRKDQLRPLIEVKDGRRRDVFKSSNLKLKQHLRYGPRKKASNLILKIILRKISVNPRKLYYTKTLFPSGSCVKSLEDVIDVVKTEQLFLLM